MGAPLHRLSAMQHQNGIRIDDGGKTVGNHHQRGMVAYRTQRLLDRLLGAGVDIGRGLVEDQDLRRLHQDPRQRQQLFLPDGEVVALLAQPGVNPLR